PEHEETLRRISPHVVTEPPFSDLRWAISARVLARSPGETVWQSRGGRHHWMKAIQVEDEVVANGLSEEIHQRGIGSAGLLFDRAIERLDAPDCDKRAWFAAEARKLGQVRQIGDHDGLGD